MHGVAANGEDLGCINGYWELCIEQQKASD